MLQNLVIIAIACHSRYQNIPSILCKLFLNQKIVNFMIQCFRLVLFHFFSIIPLDNFLFKLLNSGFFSFGNVMVLLRYFTVETKLQAEE